MMSDFSASDSAVLNVRNLSKTLGGRKVLDGLDVSVAPGEFVAILGANGSGKSTALRCIMGLTAPDSGRISIAGENVDALGGRALIVTRRQAAMVFQKINLVPRRSVLANVCAGGISRVSWARSMTPATFPLELKEEAMACLDRVGLADRAFETAGSLSGGQQQRVAIARALCQRAKLILADEPVSALDPRAAEQVMALLRELAHVESLGIAAVLHQPDLARRYADRSVGLIAGRMLFTSDAQGLTEDRLAMLYSPDRAPDDTVALEKIMAGSALAKDKR